MFGDNGNRMERPRMLHHDALHEKRPAIGSAPQLLGLEHRRPPPSSLSWHSFEKRLAIDHAVQHQVRH